VGWRHGMVVSGIHCINEVNPHQAWLVLEWMTIFGAGTPSRYVTSQLVKLSLASLLGCLIEYQVWLG